MNGGQSQVPNVRGFPYLLPNGVSHDWTLEYAPAATSSRGKILVSLDGETSSFEFNCNQTNANKTTFDRFGIVTPWIDGNCQHMYIDDLAYTTAQEL